MMIETEVSIFVAFNALIDELLMKEVSSVAPSASCKNDKNSILDKKKARQICHSRTKLPLSVTRWVDMVLHKETIQILSEFCRNILVIRIFFGFVFVSQTRIKTVRKLKDKGIPARLREKKKRKDHDSYLRN